MPRVLLLLPLLLLTGCPPRYFIWAEEQPTPSRVSLGLGTKERGGEPLQLWAFLLTTCEESRQNYGKAQSAGEERLNNAIWSIVAETAEIEEMHVDRLVLGNAPPGFAVRRDLDAPLEPGCYVAEAYASGTALLGIIVLDDGVVETFDAGSPDASWPDLKGG